MTHHLHTDFSDGRDSPAVMAEAALSRGWTAVGFSDHAPVEGESWCMPGRRLDEYFAALGALRRACEGRIDILFGLEMDWREGAPLVPDPRLDYWIGSFHIFEDAGRRFAVDGSLDQVREALAAAAGGSGRRFAERYYRGLAAMLRQSAPPVLGHLDLLKKQNGSLGFFDPGAAWYRDLVEEVLQLARHSGCVIEVNTGGMARGYLAEPYPSWDILARVRELDIPIQLNSDCHQYDTIDFAFSAVRERLAGMGFRSQRVRGRQGWNDQGL
jgi:histidinol-phosphatase (PHP family)